MSNTAADANSTTMCLHDFLHDRQPAGLRTR